MTDENLIQWLCQNPECGHIFYAPNIFSWQASYRTRSWQWCPKCRASSQRYSEVLHRKQTEEIERLTEEIERLKALVVSGFYGEDVPIYEQGEPRHELQSVVTAAYCTWLVNEVVRLRERLAKWEKPNE